MWKKLHSLPKFFLVIQGEKKVGGHCPVIFLDIVLI